jgi:hypothetical protein
MKLLLDEMWPSPIADQLRRRGHDVVAVAERPELRGQADPAIFAFAQAEGRTILTENVPDYRLLVAFELQHGGSHAGIIYTTNRRFPRHDSRTTGRLVIALDKLLRDGLAATNLEIWLS